jgi:hypothetical protein
MNKILNYAISNYYIIVIPFRFHKDNEAGKKKARNDAAITH